MIQNNLKKILIIKGIRQNELPEKTGLSIQAIFSLANHRDCKISSAIKICQALNITLNDLFNTEKFK